MSPSPKAKERLNKQSYVAFTQIMDYMYRKAEKHLISKGFICWVPQVRCSVDWQVFHRLKQACLMLDILVIKKMLLQTRDLITPMYVSMSLKMQDESTLSRLLKCKLLHIFIYMPDTMQIHAEMYSFQICQENLQQLSKGEKWMSSYFFPKQYIR